MAKINTYLHQNVVEYSFSQGTLQENFPVRSRDVTGAPSRHFFHKVHYLKQNDKHNRSLTRWRLSFVDTGIPVSCL